MPFDIMLNPTHSTSNDISTSLLQYYKTHLILLSKTLTNQYEREDLVHFSLSMLFLLNLKS